MIPTPVRRDQGRSGFADTLNRFTRSPNWLPIITIAMGFLWVTLEHTRNRVAQIRLDLRRLHDSQTPQQIGDATTLVLSRVEHLALGISALALAALLSTFLVVVLTVLCPGLSKPIRVGTFSIVLVCVFLVFWEIQ